jgi:hypothetical protein
MSARDDYETFELGDFTLEQGATLADAYLGFQDLRSAQTRLALTPSCIPPGTPGATGGMSG